MDIFKILIVVGLVVLDILTLVFVFVPLVLIIFDFGLFLKSAGMGEGGLVVAITGYMMAVLWYAFLWRAIFKVVLWKIIP